MPLEALGPLTVPTAGTKVAVSSLIPSSMWESANGPFKGHGVMFQALENNSNVVRVYQQKRDGSFVIMAVLAAPTTNFIPSFSAALTIAPNSIRIDDLYLDAQVNGEGALVDILVS